MLKANNPNIAKKVTSDTKRWIPVEREISDSDNASVLCSLLEELCIIESHTN